MRRAETMREKNGHGTILVKIIKYYLIKYYLIYYKHSEVVPTVQHTGNISKYRTGAQLLVVKFKHDTNGFNASQ